MRLLFDHQTFSIQTHGGISRYFDRLVKGINNTDHNSASLALRWSDNVYIDRPPLINVPFRGRSRLLYTINQQYSLQAIKQGEFDLFHATYYDPYFLKTIKNRPYVITIHDMIHERLHSQFPELQPDKYIFGKHLLAQKAAAIITVSEFTRQDVIALLDVDPSRVHVVYHASSLRPIEKNPFLSLQKQYLLFVGNRGHYKNFDGLLHAFSLLTDYPMLQLVCAGGGDFSIAEHKQIRNLGLTDRVTHRAFFNDEALARLYTEAKAFIFPSLYEGFGIPVLEAFSCSCPCILSKTSSLPEVAQNAALYFDPTDPLDMANVMSSLLVNEEKQADLVRKGRQRLEEFTWAKSVNQTLAVYQSVLNIEMNA